MENRMLSGYELVSKGFTKIETTLPELGLKCVQPNGSWLEEKQVQSALEARKHLIEVERIEKSGTLSIAVWKEDLMLAEVTQKVGGHWQYMGHNVGKHLFLYPEEALFLMEVNCLQLIHNDVKVSLQQAYILLLRGKITLLQYKVYASLSRLGYRIFRHGKSTATNNEKKINSHCNLQVDVEIRNWYTNGKFGSTSSESEDRATSSAQHTSNVDDTTMDNNGHTKTKTYSTLRKHRSIMYNRLKLQKLKNRKARPCSIDIIDNYFNDLPNLLTKDTVTIKVPNEGHVPKNINLSKGSYEVNMETVSNKTQQTASSDANIYSVDDEVNGNHIRRLRNTSANTRPSQGWTPQSQYFRFQQNPQYQPFYYMNRPRPFYCNFNTLLQRTFFPRWHNQPFRFYPMNQPFYMNPNVNFYDNNIIYTDFTNNRRKRKKSNYKKHHLDCIKRLAQRLKYLISSGNRHSANIQSLQRLINTYNERYKTKVTLTNNLDVIVNETVVDTIELDDEDDIKIKKRKTDVEEKDFNDNVQMLKQLALQLRTLENNGKATPRHKRFFSKALKTLNESYNVEYHINEMYEVINSRLIDLDSTSDSDCVVEEDIKKGTSKQLKNPFNVLKRLSEKSTGASEPQSSTSQREFTVQDNNKYNEIFNSFPKHWLPNENDFGRAEIIMEDFSDVRQEEFIYDFCKMQPNKYNNWLELKKSYFNSLEETMAEFVRVPKTVNKDIKSLVKPEDCTDMCSVLNKLRIIKTATEVSEECHLSVDFDVYNRDVQNFKKTNPPKPHFRIICFEASSNVPTGEDIATLHTKYEDNIAIVFAVVSDASVSYVQMNPSDLPVYIASNTAP